MWKCYSQIRDDDTRNWIHKTNTKETGYIKLMLQETGYIKRILQETGCIKLILQETGCIKLKHVQGDR